MKISDKNRLTRPVQPKIYIVLLITGMAGGVIGALYGTLSKDETVSALLSPEEIAQVNGTSILKSKYLEQLDAVRADRRSDLSREQERQILDRLIDEELLVQSGLDTGFANSDKNVRGAIVTGMISSILEEVNTRQPTEAELKKFHVDNIQLFTPEDKVVISRIVFNHADRGTAHGQAMQLYSRMSEELSFDKVGQSLSSSDSEIMFIPAVMMPLTEMREYFGPDVVSEVRQLKQERVAEPVSTLSGTEIIFVNEYIHGEPPLFNDMRDTVEQAYLQVKGEKALQEYLSGLRRKSTIRITE